MKISPKLQALRSKAVWSQCSFRLFVLLPEQDDLKHGEIKTALEHAIKIYGKHLKSVRIIGNFWPIFVFLYRDHFSAKFVCARSTASTRPPSL